MNSGHLPNGINSGHQPNGVNSHHQQNGTIPPTGHTPNGTSPQHERGGTNLERQQGQSAAQGQAPMPLQQAPMEDDYPITGIRVPASTDESPHYVPLEIRDCGCHRRCKCRYPDLREFLGEHEIWDIDYQMFQAHWEPPGMESLHGTYMLFTIKTPTLDRSHQPWNEHFLARLKGDVFILKVKESIDETVVSTGDPNVRHRSRSVVNARYEHIGRCFFGSDLFKEMTMAATHPYTRVCNPLLAKTVIPLGSRRASFQERVRAPNYQMRTEKDRIWARFWPPHRGS